jgi:hypothetical protein
MTKKKKQNTYPVSTALASWLSNKGPVKVLGTTPGKVKWSKFAGSRMWEAFTRLSRGEFRRSCVAWTLKLSSTLVKGENHA